jgi:hypothetical protein
MVLHTIITILFILTDTLTEKFWGNFQTIGLTTGALSGDLARTMGSAKEDTTKPIVINIASSYAAVLLEPEFSA